ncbi:preprotein translocase subunit SecG [Blochmannia endosymbiont of Camponotus (Colobopsis) obliquus]|uniref:preprotein translocase subunit SecG n=1 Tax=Blochmannia endosymbiont of Camponotus (Colobopsis) obliquus TaxID=1505597 RepID=UPI00061A7041|nr:preprotein translocase subunit SecG [Blochmannia endosymbiont of Camponotus (Colobopsis) obliquus]AKC60278.1 Protein-export membrane protein SecG [Blochmannia endosymbiont of Camponotus (Colobopsis) obliquus]
MYRVLLIVFLLISIMLVTLIMLQDNKHTDIKSGLSSEYSTAFFSASSYGNYITGMITVLAFLFFIFSLILGNISNKHNTSYVDSGVVYEKNSNKLMQLTDQEKDSL